jgi:nucleotide-binding universal stress UspA family protein
LRKYSDLASENPYLIMLNSLIPQKTDLRRPQARPLLFRQSGGVGAAADLSCMIGFKHIFCPTDLTPESDAALRYAVALAARYGAKLTVCHCAEAPSPVDRTMREKFRKRVEACVRQWTGVGHCPPADLEGIVIEGHPGEAIVKTAAERRVDLIVMRSRRRPIAAALLGSVAETVCRTAPCPVLVTHSGESEWVGLTSCEIDLRRILVAQDFSIESELALQLAISLAQEYQTELHLLHVLPASLAPVAAAPHPPHPMHLMHLGMEFDFHRAAQALKRSIPDEVYLWCKVVQAVNCGQPYREILSYAEENDIDLICMGVHGAGFAMRALFGSNTDRVLRQAPCPTLIARPLKPASINNSADGRKND